MRVDISGWELHNIVKTADGQLRTRRALTSLKTPTGGTVFVGGFTVESPSTTEVWHYLFEQGTTDSSTTLRVMSEEFTELFNYPLGVLQADPVITYAVQYGQIMISSPAFSFTLYGLVGGGMTTAIKTPSINTDTTAIDIPEGHICAWGDRMAIARGNVVYVNDPPAAQGQNFDPRTFVGQNAIPLPGTVLDLFAADDGVLRIFTTNGAFSLPSDAIGQGQAPVGFLQRIPGINTMRARNAAASNGQVFVLERDGIVQVSRGGIMQIGPATPMRLPLPAYLGRRNFSQVVAVDDLRLAAELFATPDGFLVGFRGKRGFFLDVNVKTLSASYTTSIASSFNVVGTLRSRDGEALLVFSDRVAAPMISGATDYDGNVVRGVACGRIDVDGSNPIIRRIIVESGACGGNVGAYVSGSAQTTAAPSLKGEAVIGTTQWNVAATQKLAGRQDRSVRRSYSLRLSDPHIEIVSEGGDRHMASEIDVTTIGQGLQREDKN